MADDRIKLTLDLGTSTADAKALGDALQTVKADANAAASSAAMLDAALDEIGLGQAQVTKSIDATSTAIGDLGKTTKKVADTVEGELTPGLDKAAKGTANYGRATLEAGRVAQDFAQGGLAGILNNIEGLTMALGGTAGLAGVLTAVSIGFWLVVPAVKAAWSELAEGKNPVPKSADALVRMNDQLKTSSDRLGELKTQQSLTNAELLEFNRLSVESTKLQRELSAARSKQQAADAARSQKTPEQQATGAAATALSGGKGYDKLISAASGVDKDVSDYHVMNREYEALKAKDKRTPEEGRRIQELAVKMNQLAKNPAIQDSSGESARKTAEAEDLAQRARGGDTDAYDQLLKRTKGDVHDQLAASDPRKAGQRKFNQDAAMTGARKAIGGFVNPLVTGLKERRADDKLADDLNRQGQQGEAEFQAEEEKAHKDELKDLTRKGEEIAVKKAKAAKAMARSVVKDPVPILPMERPMPLTPMPQGWDNGGGGQGGGGQGGGFNPELDAPPPRQVYIRQTRAQRTAASRRKRERREAAQRDDGESVGPLGMNEGGGESGDQATNEPGGGGAVAELVALNGRLMERIAALTNAVSGHDGGLVALRQQEDSLPTLSDQYSA